VLATIVSGLLTLGFSAAHAAEDAFAEYQLKAAYIYNFVTFTEWPGATGATLTLCIYGPDPFGADIDSLQGKSVGDRALEVLRVSSVEQLASCQIVFLSREVLSNLPRIMDVLQGNTVLTIADSPGAARSGVALNMTTAQERVTFEVNLRAAQQHGINLSFRLLRLATEVFN
jgi:hypothetical protein